MLRFFNLITAATGLTVSPDAESCSPQINFIYLMTQWKSLVAGRTKAKGKRLAQDKMAEWHLLKQHELNQVMHRAAIMRCLTSAV